MKWLLDAYLDGRTYTTLAYLLLALPLGVIGFSVVVAGLSGGAGMLITLAGIPVLVGTLLFASAFARLHRRLAWSLLDAPIPRLGPDAEPVPGIFWARLRQLIRKPGAGREVWFALLAMPLGILGFAVVATVVWLMAVGFIQPILVMLGVHSDWGSWTVDTVAESLLYLPVSLLFLLVGPRLMLGWGTVIGRAVAALLGHVEPQHLKRGIVDVLSRRGDADGFTILDDLWLRFGRGPYITPVQVEATLFALEGRGTILADRGGVRTVYRLA